MDIRWLLVGCVVLAAALASEEDDGSVPDAELDEDEDTNLSLDEEESRNLRPRAYTPSAYSNTVPSAYSPNTVPSGFRPTASLAELAGYQQRDDDGYVQPTHAQQHAQQQQLYVDQQHQYQQQPRQPPRAPHRKPEQRPSKLQQLQQEVEDELEEDKEEPDRLATLLQQSKFDCVSKSSGYYADEELNCEVFHYCQDNVKHSWICPEGFTFHQVHLICMPPNHDNICQRSSKYHFVNEYLYRPINEEEVQRKPNVSLRYSDRYYPSEVYNDDRYDQDEEEPPRRTQAPPPAQRPQSAPQVFRSAEEVNIPLGQRRPQRPYELDF